MIQHIARLENDAIVIGLVKRHVEAVVKAGGEIWFSLSQGNGPAVIVCRLPEATDPNTVAPLPEPHTWEKQ